MTNDAEQSMTVLFDRFKRINVIANLTWPSTKRSLNIVHILTAFVFVRLLSVLCGHSVFSSPPQRPMTSVFEGFSIPDFIHYIYFPIFILEKEPVFPFWRFSAKQGNYWYHFYNVFGMTRSLTWDWTRDLPHSKPALYLSRRRYILTVTTINHNRTVFLITSTSKIANIFQWFKWTVLLLPECFDNADNNIDIIIWV